MRTVICNALFGETRVPPSETRGPLTTIMGWDVSTESGSLSSVIAVGETKLPVARTSVIDSWASEAVVDWKSAEILKLLFERTSKGTRITGALESALVTVIRTVLPVLTTPASVKFGATESATVSLTFACITTRPVWAFTPAGKRITTATSVKRG